MRHGTRVEEGKPVMRNWKARRRMDAAYELMVWIDEEETAAVGLCDLVWHRRQAAGASGHERRAWDALLAEDRETVTLCRRGQEDCEAEAARVMALTLA